MGYVARLDICDYRPMNNSTDQLDDVVVTESVRRHFQSETPPSSSHDHRDYLLVMYPLLASVMLILALVAATQLRDGAPYMPWAVIDAVAIGSMVIVLVLGVKRWKRTRP